MDCEFYKFDIYKKPGEKFTLDVSKSDSNNDYYETMAYCGFHKERLCYPYFYRDENLPCVELIKLSNDNGESILSLMDHNGTVQEFFCENRELELDLYLKFTEAMKNIIQFEYFNKIIYKMQEDEGQRPLAYRNIL